MTVSEFKAWLDGFKEAIGEAPTPDQWQRVLEKMATVSENVPLLPMPHYPSPLISPVWCGPNQSQTVAPRDWQTYNAACAVTQAMVNGTPCGPSD